MTIRTAKRTMTFGSPFALTGIEKCLPAGTYDVATEESKLMAFRFRPTGGGYLASFDELEMAYGQERKMNQQDQ